MKTGILNIIMGALLCGAASGILAGCAADEPFADGEGTLRMQLLVNSTLTRAEVTGEEEQHLAETCLIFISNSGGLLHRFEGLENKPDRLVLRAGSYVAEAYAGDSVSASFDKRFFKAREEFTIQPNDETNVALSCKIANVVVGVEAASVDDNLLKDWNIEISHTRGKLDFNKENASTATGYFMMPSAQWGKDASGKYTDFGTLNYKLTGTDARGQKVEKTGKIEHVQAAHYYKLSLKFGEVDPGDNGGLPIKIIVDDTELEVLSEIIILGGPRIMSNDEFYNIDKVIIGQTNSFANDMIVGVTSHGKLQELKMTFNNPEAFGLTGAEYDVIKGSSDLVSQLNAIGIHYASAEGKNDTFGYNITFSKDLLNKLGNGDYTIGFEAVDVSDKRASKEVHIIISDAKVMIEELEPANVRSKHVTLTATILKDDVTNPGIEYREKGTETAWTKAYPATKTRAAGTSVTVTLSELKPSTIYEYRAFADGYEDAIIHEVTTESVFVIPNASFEDWGTTSKHVNNAIIPALDYNTAWWDCGNHGSMTLGSNYIVTDKSTDMKHSGTYSARLETKKVLVALAAGNIFFGAYKETKGTNGVLNLGRPFDGSHPKSLTVWANYRPATVSDVKSGCPSDITKGGTDHGQIYVALTTEQHIADTSDKSTLFKADGPEVVAYGEVTWTAAFGPDGQLQKVEIPLSYVASKLSVKPKYLIIVASASKFGDYFSGGAGSVLYLDDFELIYD